METQSRSNTTTLIVSCAGAGVAGQAANQAAVDLQQEGHGRMLCHAAIANRVEGILDAARDAERIVAIDGCSTACARKTLEQADLTVTDHVVATDLGLPQKMHGGVLDSTAVARVKNAVKARLETIPGGPFCS